MPEEVTQRRDNGRLLKRKGLGYLSHESTKKHGSGWCRKELVDYVCHIGIGVCCRSITGQCQKVRFFCFLWKGDFGMNNVAPPTLLTNGSCRCRPLLNVLVVRSARQGDFMQLYLAAGFPDHEVWNIGMTFS